MTQLPLNEHKYCVPMSKPKKKYETYQYLSISQTGGGINIIWLRFLLP